MPRKKLDEKDKKVRISVCVKKDVAERLQKKSNEIGIALSVYCSIILAKW
jgi:hypothetical protein